MSTVTKECVSKPEDKLFNAVRMNKFRLVRLLIEGGVHVDSRNSNEQTPLLILSSSLRNASHGRSETYRKVFKYLVAAGADVNAADASGRTPLIYSVITRLSIFYDLLNAGADPWSQDRSGKCAFDYAIQQKDLHAVEKMVESCKKARSYVVGDTRGTRGLDKVEGQGDRREKNKNKQTKRSKSPIKSRKEFSKSRQMYSAPNLRVFHKIDQDSSFAHPKPSSLQHDASKHTLSIHMHSNVDSLKLTANPTPSSDLADLQENIHLCDLCKTVFKVESVGKELKSEVKVNEENLKLLEYDFSGLLFRRRSTGSLLGSTKRRNGSFRREQHLALTMDDMFSNSSFDHSDKSNDEMFDDSETNQNMEASNELLIPDRLRSMSLPPAHSLIISNVTDDKTESPSRSPSFSRKAISIALAWPSSTASGSHESCDNSGKDENFDDAIIVPAVFRSITSSSVENVTSSSDGEHCPSSIAATFDRGKMSCENRRDDCQSPIPTIILTDYVSKS